MIIYGLCASDLPGVVRYVGKTSLRLTARVNAHVSRALRQPLNTHKENWIRSVVARGCRIEGVGIAFATTDEEAYRLEHHYILGRTARPCERRRASATPGASTPTRRAQK